MAAPTRAAGHAFLPLDRGKEPKKKKWFSGLRERQISVHAARLPEYHAL
jgi:hypothetical protein